MPPLELPGGGKPGGPASPQKQRQRRIMLAIGAGMVLALVVMLGRGRGAPEEEANEAEPQGTAGEPPIGSTFADNGEAAGALSSSITQGLADVYAGQADQAQAFQDLASALQTPAAAPVTLNIAPGALGTTGSVGAAAAAKKRTTKLPAKGVVKGKDHGSLGFHRTGKNTYTHSGSAYTWRRVKGGFERVPGSARSGPAAKKPKPKMKPKPKPKPKQKPKPKKKVSGYR